MLFPIFPILLLSTACVIPLVVLSLVWSFRVFPYTAKGQQISQRRKQLREAGLWKLLTDYHWYDRESGERAERNVTILRGIGVSTAILVSILLSTALVLLVVSYFNLTSTKVLCLAYCGILALCCTFVFPDQLIKYSSMPGRWIDLLVPGDMPTTPAFWGAVLSIYTTAIILKRFPSLDIQRYLDGLPEVFSRNTIHAVPFALFLLVFPLIGAMPSIKFNNNVLFCVSWGIGALAALLLGIALVGV